MSTMSTASFLHRFLQVVTSVVVSSFALSSSDYCVVLCVAVAHCLLCRTNNCKLLETSSCFD